MNKNANSACGMMMYFIIAVVVISMSVVFVKATYHPEPAQPRAPMHAPK